MATSDLFRITKMAVLYFAVRVFFVELHFDWNVQVIHANLGGYLFETLTFVLLSEILTRGTKRLWS